MPSATSLLMTTRHRLALGAIVCGGTLLRALAIPAGLDGTDPVNFALSLERFDLALHQPHFPGYPLYVLAVRAAGLLIRDPVWVLSLPALLAGIVMILSVHHALRYRYNAQVALWGAVLLAAHPVLVEVGGAPLSDGLALGLVAVSFSCIAIGRFPTAGLVMAAALGVRPSFAPLGLGLLLCVAWCEPKRLRATGPALFIGVVAWLAPLVWLVGPADFFRLGWEHVTGHFGRFGGAVSTVGATSLLDRILELGASTFAGWQLLLPLGLLGIVLWRRERIADTYRSRWILPVGLAVAPYAVWVLLAQSTAHSRHAAPLALFAIVTFAPLAAFLARMGEKRLAPAALVAGVFVALAATLTGPVAHAQRASDRLRLARYIASTRGRERLLFLGTHTPRVAAYYAPGLRTGRVDTGSDVARIVSSLDGVEVLVSSEIPALAAAALELEPLARFDSLTLFTARPRRLATLLETNP